MLRMPRQACHAGIFLVYYNSRRARLVWLDMDSKYMYIVGGLYPICHVMIVHALAVSLFVLNCGRPSRKMREILQSELNSTQLKLSACRKHNIIYVIIHYYSSTGPEWESMCTMYTYVGVECKYGRSWPLAPLKLNCFLTLRSRAIATPDCTTGPSPRARALPSTIQMDFPIFMAI